MLRTKQISEANRAARFRELLQTGFDLDYIGRFVLGRHWRAASDPQRTAYLDLFAQYVVKTYASRLQGYSGQSFVIVSERVAGIKDIVVRTRIGRPGGGAAINADWRVRKYHDSYRIIDVMVAGISMVVTQRQEFDAVIRRVGINGLSDEPPSRSVLNSSSNTRQTLNYAPPQGPIPVSDVIHESYREDRRNHRSGIVHGVGIIRQRCRPV